MLDSARPGIIASFSRALTENLFAHQSDDEFDRCVRSVFNEAYMTHTSTSPNYQILASLDLGRRQVALEGVLRIAGDEDDLQVRLAAASTQISTEPGLPAVQLTSIACQPLGRVSS